MVVVQAKKKAVLVEPDCEPTCKKRRIADSKSQFVPVLLQLRAISLLRGGQHSLVISCPGPLLHPSTFCSFPSRTPYSGHIAASPGGAYATTISYNAGEADKEQPTQHCAKEAKVTSFKSTGTSLTQPCHFPPERPLPSAPCFPKCPPPPPPHGLVTMTNRLVAT